MSASYSSRIPQIIARSEQVCALAVQKVGFDIEAGAKMRARVDTGAMKNSIQWTPDGPYSGSVIAGVHYAKYHEYGTVHMSAQPMLVPAAEDARLDLIRDISRAWT